MYSFIHSFKKKIYLNILKTVPFDNCLPETNKQTKKNTKKKAHYRCTDSGPHMPATQSTH